MLTQEFKNLGDEVADFLLCFFIRNERLNGFHQRFHEHFRFRKFEKTTKATDRQSHQLKNKNVCMQLLRLLHAVNVCSYCTQLIYGVVMCSWYSMVAQIIDI